MIRANHFRTLQRLVVLKLIKAGMSDDAVVQRFQSERQSLAIMDHPAIAKVFDAGTTPGGQPYFVMEYVDALPITEYCDRKKLGVRERLDLLLQIQNRQNQGFQRRRSCSSFGVSGCTSRLVSPSGMVESPRLQTGIRVAKSAYSTSLRFEGTRMHADFADLSPRASAQIRVP